MCKPAPVYKEETVKTLHYLLRKAQAEARYWKGVAEGRKA
jgi:hypothetical protein